MVLTTDVSRLPTPRDRECQVCDEGKIRFEHKHVMKLHEDKSTWHLIAIFAVSWAIVYIMNSCSFSMHTLYFMHFLGFQSCSHILWHDSFSMRNALPPCWEMCDWRATQNFADLDIWMLQHGAMQYSDCLKTTYSLCRAHSQVNVLMNPPWNDSRISQILCWTEGSAGSIANGRVCADNMMWFARSYALLVVLYCIESNRLVNAPKAGDLLILQSL